MWWLSVPAAHVFSHGASCGFSSSDLGKNVATIEGEGKLLPFWPFCCHYFLLATEQAAQTYVTKCIKHLSSPWSFGFSSCGWHSEVPPKHHEQRLLRPEAGEPQTVRNLVATLPFFTGKNMEKNNFSIICCDQYFYRNNYAHWFYTSPLEFC